MMTDEFLRHGLAAAPVKLVELRAGSVRLSLDPSTGSLRWFRCGGREVLRGIYFALRDRNWGTVPGEMRERQRRIGTDAFRIEFECEHRREEIHFVWRGLIEGESDGTVRYTCDGEALRVFLKSRIGFCVLHPIRECAGARVRQIRTTGEVIEGCLPCAIEPQIFGQASFQDLRGLVHEIEPGRWAELTFEGEVFELEDQRNWTDASFKTYCTPLARPFPVEVRPGEHLRQVVTLRLVGEVISGPEGTFSGGGDGVVTIEPSSRDWIKMPEVGLGLASDGEPLTGKEIQRLRALGLDHVRYDARLEEGDWDRALNVALKQVGELGINLELAIHLPRVGTAGLSELSEILGLGRGGGRQARIGRLLVLREGEGATGSESVGVVRKAMGGQGVLIGAGSDCNFCELNREQAMGRFGVEGADFVFWSINPQVHAVDSWSVMETLEAQGETVRSARRFAGGRSLVISPITLKQRFNPVASGPEPRPAPGELPPQVDSRQLSLFAAAWTLGSLRALAEAGATSVTYYETTGWRGIMARAHGSAEPAKFPAEPGMVFPVYVVLAALKGFERCQALESDVPQSVVGLSLSSGSGQGRLLLGNLTGKAVEANVKGLRGDWRVRTLEVETARRAMREPESFWAEPGKLTRVEEKGLRLTLTGHAVVVLECEQGGIAIVPD